MSMWEPWTEHARRSVVLGQEEAQRLRHNYIGTEHLLLGMISEGENPAAKVLAMLGVDLAKARTEVEAIVARGENETTQQQMVFSRNAKRVIELAFEEARQVNHNYIGTEHLLLGLIRQTDAVARRVLENLSVNFERARQEVLALAEAGPTSPTETSQRSQLSSAMRSETEIWQLLLFLADDAKSLTGRALKKLGVDPAELERVLEELAREDAGSAADT